MKKYLSMLAFVAGAFMIASCSGSEADEEINNDPKVMTFKISSPSTTPSSRAKVDELHADRGSDVVWEDGDEICVFGDINRSIHKITYEKQDGHINSAIFKGTSFESDVYFFMYPYQSNATFDGTYLHATIPTIQQATENSFDKLAAICGGNAVKSSADVTLLHACAFFMIETKGDCEYIRIEPENNSKWCFTGGVKLGENSSGTKITIDASTGGRNYVQLQADRNESEANPSKTFKAGKYLIAVASSKSFPQLRLKVKYQGHAVTTAVSTTSGQQYAAGTVNDLGDVPVPTSY